MRSLALALAVLAAAPAAAGSRPVDEHRPLAPDAKVSVSNVAGSVEVEAWDKGELSLTGELSNEVEELRITGSAADLQIVVKLPHDVDHTGRTHLKLKVPAGVTLKVDAVSADVAVRGVKGPIAAKSVSGDVAVDAPSARVSADSVSGDVRVTAPSTVTHAQTVSGDVRVRGAGDRVDAQSVSGDIDVEARQVRAVNVKTVSGGVRLSLDLAPDGGVEAQTMSGEISLSVPAATSAAVSLESFSGDVSSAFGKLEGDEGQQRTQTLGAGKGKITLGSFSGEVELKKR